MAQARKQPVRRGGLETPEGYRFEITGGALCLDLANTVDNRPATARRELLRDYGDLVDWACQAGVVDGAAAARLRRAGVRRRDEAAAVLRGAVRLRETIFTVFSALADGRRPPAGALVSLNRALSSALRRLQVALDGEGYRWSWSGAAGLDAMLPPVVRSAAELLTSEELPRLRECAAADCAWLFLDRSRNRSRRWCDMSVCGNRDKARRHYRRTRGAR